MVAVVLKAKNCDSTTLIPVIRMNGKTSRKLD